jgi:PAS domain S-box-containing protein
MVSATIGTTSLLLGGAIALDELGSVWRLWWLGDMGGDLLVAPVLMVLASRPWRELAGWRVVEAGGLVVALAGVTVLAFSSEMPLAYLAFPGLVVAALRFRQLGATVGSLVVASIAVWITARGMGPFTGAAPDDRLLESQTFFGVGALTALLLAAVLTERGRAEEEVRRSYQLLSAVAEGTPDAVCVRDTESRYLMVNTAGSRAIGRPVEEVLGRSPTELFAPDVARGLIDDDRRVMSTGRAEAVEEEVRSWSGARTFLSMKSPLRDEHGGVSGVTCISHDITDRKQVEDTQRLLAETSKVLADSLDLEQALEAVARSAVPRLGDCCVVHMLDDDGALRPIAIAHADPDKEALVRELTRRYPPDPNAAEGVAAVVRAGRSELIPELTDYLLRAAARDSEHLALIRQLGLRSAMVVPLRARGRTLGGLSLASAESGRHFDEDDLCRAEDLAARCAMAADNARLYRHEHTVAETLQRSFLPGRLPQLAGIELAARYLPGSATVDVGGDWYDALRRPDGALVLVMGDVAGRGLRAASAMGQLRNAVRAYALEGRSPAAILAAVNRLAHAVELEDMATMLCVVYEPTTGVLRLASAGHLPPLAISPDGDVRALEEGGSVPLNVDVAARFAETEDRLEPGSTLLLYTDGLVERSQGTLAEGLRILRLAAAEGPKTCEALCDHIIEHLLGAERGDDVALVALQTLPVGNGRLRLRRPAAPTALADTRRALGRWLEEAGASREETFAINLAAGEACSNAIEHAYGPADAELEIEADLADDRVAVTVRDFGRWRRPRGEDRGRGLVLMRGLMDDVEIIHGDNGTTVRMSRRLAGAAGRHPPQSTVVESATDSRARPPARSSPTLEPAAIGAKLRLTHADDLVIATLGGEVDRANAQDVSRDSPGN